ncbi:MAG: hypothetical protein K2P12_05285 [Clostridia bacterium]|nr:hypothetical protein [Clostridia bacterium]
MKKEISNQNEEERVLNSLDSEANSEFLDKEEFSAKSQTETAESVSLGSFTDTAIVQGVLSNGIFGEDIKVKNESVKDLDNIAKEDTESTPYVDMGEAVADEEVSADDFDNMNNIIDGHKRKPRKKRKRPKSKVRRIVVRTYCTIILGVISIVAVYYGVNFFKLDSTQGVDGAEVIVDMTNLPYYVGTGEKVDIDDERGKVKIDETNTIDLLKIFPNATSFAFKDGNPSNAKIKNNELTINGVGDFSLSIIETVNDKTITVDKEVKVVESAVNAADWETFELAVKAQLPVCVQNNYIAYPVLEGVKESKVSGLLLKNDIFGNGCKLNMFELVVCRNKKVGGKLTKPYLQGNGPFSGFSAFRVVAKEDGSAVRMQDLHIIGNDMKTEEGGNLAGVSQNIIDKRGLKLMSAYGVLICVEGEVSYDERDQKVLGQKANFELVHCVLENSYKLIHVKYGDMMFEGNIIRNASDTTLSIATYANEKSVVRSRNNVIANSLTGGVVFYCYDASINEGNKNESWNDLIIEDGTFLDIYNWKPQDGLAFMPETESGSEIANPIAKSEIPKAKYDSLKATANGQKYIHFAIIKLKTGSGMKINGSSVKNYQSLGYKTSKDYNYEKGFPLPSVAAAIITDIDVWGYYANDQGSVKPTDTLNEESLKVIYEELKYGRKKAA